MGIKLKSLKLRTVKAVEVEEPKKEAIKLKVAPPKKIKLFKKAAGKAAAKKKSAGNALPPDEYKDLIEPLEMNYDNDKSIIFSVKRAGELGLPYVDIRLYVSNDKYVGFTKKGISFPLEFIQEAIEHLQEIDDECERAKIE